MRLVAIEVRVARRKRGRILKKGVMPLCVVDPLRLANAMTQRQTWPTVAAFLHAGSSAPICRRYRACWRKSLCSASVSMARQVRPAGLTVGTSSPATIAFTTASSIDCTAPR